MFVGTNLGRLLTFKILPSRQGTYSVQVAGSVTLDEKVLSITPLNAETGKPAAATQAAVSALREGHRVNGVVVAVTTTGVRIFKPSSSKGASKGWNEYFCDAASIVSSFDGAIALVGLFGDGHARTFSIPGLKELSAMRIGHLLDARRLPDAMIAPTGDVFGWTGPSELIVVNAWGVGEDKSVNTSKCYTDELTRE